MPKSSRRQARIIAFQIIYQRQKIGVQENGETLLKKQTPVNQEHAIFTRDLVDTTWQQLPTVDEHIQKHLQGWRQDRISDTLNALLRVAVSELFFFQKTDGKVVINEALEICKSHVDSEATSLLNGVLHAVWNSTKPSE